MLSRSAFYFVTVSGIALGGQALAQPLQGGAAGAGNVEEVVVTGTRIQTTGYEQPTPVTVVTAQALVRTQPAGVATALTEMPQFDNSTSPRMTANNTANGNRGNFLNLRNLGPNRALILQDGVRVPPTGGSGQVSIDVIPDLLVQRVDVVTGGTAAVYGSDAVAGVVNFVLDKNFTGVKGVVQGGVSQVNDLGSYRAGVAAGMNFSDKRGHVLLSVSRSDAGGITKQDRPYMKFKYLAVPLVPAGTPLPGGGVAGAPGTATNPLYIRSPVVSNTNAFGGAVTAGPPGVVGLQFTPNDAATPFPRDSGQFAGTTAQFGGSGSVLRLDGTLVTPTKTDTAFGRLSYDVTDNINTFVEVQAFGSRYRAQVGDNFGTVPIMSGNPYIPASVQATLNTIPNIATAGFPTAVAACGAGRANPTPAALCLNSTATFGSLGLAYLVEEDKGLVARAGMTVDLSDTWKFDATYVFGQVRDRTDEYNGLYQQHLYAALDAVRDASGNIVCRVTVTNPGLYPGCVPWNPFGVRSFTQAQSDWLRGKSLYNSSYFEILNMTHDVVANLTGELFHTWAGPIGVALGAEYRTGLLKQTSNSDPATQFDKTGIRGILAASPPWVLDNTGSARGSVKVYEFNGELQVPLAKDIAFAKELSVTAAGRYTHYNTSGGVESWKVGGSWAPVDALRFRATRSRDIRAPTLFDLYAGLTSGSAPFNDIHCNCARPSGVLMLGGGNPDLKPEKANTLTIGFVAQPSFLPHFQISVDYYKINVKDALSRLTATQIVQDCENSGGVAPTCAFVNRPFPFSDRRTANAPLSIFSGNINAAFLKTSGVDIDMSYTLPLDELRDNLSGSLTVRLYANYTEKYRYQASPTSVVSSAAGWTEGPTTTIMGLPHWKATLSIDYLNDPWSLSARVRYIGKLNTGPVNVYADKELPEFMYTDLTLTRSFKAFGVDFDGFLTVNNVFDKNPPLYPNTSVPAVGYPTLQSLYDVVGRYYTAGTRFQF